MVNSTTTCCRAVYKEREREREESASERKTGDYTWPHVKLVNGFIYVSSLATTTS